MNPAYLDHNATTPLRPAALEAMLPWLRGPTGNPSSTHRDGCRARAALDEARATLAAILGARPEELVFTSGGTESNNLALKGSLTSGELITLASEHPSVLGPARAHASARRPLRELLPGPTGLLDLGRFRAALGEKTRLVSVQWVNHETGAIQPIAELGSLLVDHPALFHVDGVQALGRLPIQVAQMKIDLLTSSSHKIGGPVGIGALYIRNGRAVTPQVLGGAQEQGLRAGTSPVALAVGFAAAAVEAERDRETVRQRHSLLRDLLVDELQERFPDVVLNGPEEECVPGTVSVAFPGADLESLLVQLDLHSVRVSSGAACASGTQQPSTVLKAMALPQAVQASTVRISMGPHTGRTDLEQLLAALVVAVPNARRKPTII